jgi:hypothetical protein
MVKKRKTAKGTAQKVGNPPKHPQFGKGTAGNPKGWPRTLCKAARDQVLATARGRSRTNFGATSDGDELALVIVERLLDHATAAISVLRIRWP